MGEQVIYAITDHMDKSKNAGLASPLSMAVKQFSRLMEDAAKEGNASKVEALAGQLVTFVVSQQRQKQSEPQQLEPEIEN